jgi:phage baseplate assembly protein W
MEYLLNDPSTERKAFLGRGWAFPPEFSAATGTVVMVQHEEDIWQSLQILFSTSLTERVLQPDYGCNLEDYIFDPLSASRLSFLEELIRKDISLFEPRIKLERLGIQPMELEGRLDITLTYIVRSTNTRFNRVYPFYKQEGTNVEL